MVLTLKRPYKWRSGGLGAPPGVLSKFSGCRALWSSRSRRGPAEQGAVLRARAPGSPRAALGARRPRGLEGVGQPGLEAGAAGSGDGRSRRRRARICPGGLLLIQKRELRSSDVRGRAP